MLSAGPWYCTSVIQVKAQLFRLSSDPVLLSRSDSSLLPMDPNSLSSSSSSFFLLSIILASLREARQAE